MYSVFFLSNVVKHAMQNVEMSPNINAILSILCSWKQIN